MNALIVIIGVCLVQICWVTTQEMTPQIEIVTEKPKPSFQAVLSDCLVVANETIKNNGLGLMEYYTCWKACLFKSVNLITQEDELVDENLNVKDWKYLKEYDAKCKTTLNSKDLCLRAVCVSKELKQFVKEHPEYAYILN